MGGGGVRGRAIIAKDEAQHMGHFYESARHTIQGEFGIYVHDQMKEIERGGGGEAGGAQAFLKSHHSRRPRKLDLGTASGHSL